ncbi:MAG: hypothetical protein M3Q17_10575, partial [Actinomycetota bacterium]|nr:hypothetical protein [Actinomycetota bacterium]
MSGQPSARAHIWERDDVDERHSTHGLPDALSTAEVGPAVDHEPDTAITAVAEVGIGTPSPVRSETRSSIPGLWPTKTTVS